MRSSTSLSFSSFSTTFFSSFPFSFSFPRTTVSAMAPHLSMENLFSVANTPSLHNEKGGREEKRRKAKQQEKERMGKTTKRRRKGGRGEREK